MKRFLAILLSLTVLCQAVTATGSNDSVPERRVNSVDSMQYLENVIVYGRKPYAEVIPAQVLSAKTLEGLNSHSVADAIRYFSGVQLKDYGGVGGIKTVDIRSMGTNHMGVFYDGIQLGNAQNGQIDLGKFSLDNIEEISLYNGQKSDIFQPARDYGSAGTIYLRTRKPKFNDGKRDNINFTMRTGSFDLVNPSLRWEHKLNRSVSFTLNAEYTYASGQYHFRYRKKFSDGTLAWDTTALRRNGDVHAWRAEGAVFGAIPDGKWNAKFYYYDSERGIPGAIVNNVWKNSQRQWDRNFFTQGGWQKKVSERYEAMVNAKYARDYMHYVNPDTTLMLIDNKFWQDEIYVSSANKFTIVRDWDVNLSLDYKWNYLNSTLVNFSYPTRHTGLAALATAYTLGGFKAQASLLYTMVNDLHESRNAGQTIAHHSQWMHKFTPAAFFSYAPWVQHDLNFRAFYKRIFRMPTFNDLYYTDIGNASLKPEYVDQYNLGFQYQLMPEEGIFAGFKISADAYYNHVTDKIIAVPKGTGQYRWMMMNIGKVKIRGVDVTARTSLRPLRDVRLDLNLNYTYQRAQDYSKPDDYGDGGTYKGQIAYIPWHSGSAVFHASWRDVVELNYSFIYVGERYHTSSNIPANHEQPWYTHDISAHYTFGVGKTRIKVTGEVNNLFNQYYDVIQNYPMPGRNFKIILKFDI
ncbi:TonB-dependent receptor [Sodaliphilus sp.]|uniref:TonB-dependent receptor n=1 Tax=Sodaliphilus sp. TaxID=2815818 RepID=UPI003890CCC1